MNLVQPQSRTDFRVTTAVIPVAGAGTRVFPMTTAVEKCMMPVYIGSESRPLVDFMVEDCAKAGITRIIFVTSERGKQQLQDFYGDMNEHLQNQLLALGKESLIAAEEARRSSRGLSFEYIIQPPGTYGTTVPLALAQESLKDEAHFVLMGGDDFVWHRDGTSELALAIATWKHSGADHVIMGNPVTRAEGVKYGILSLDGEGVLKNIDEKPPLERVPEQPLANISRYLFSDTIWPFVNQEMSTIRGSEQPEHYITYPITAAAQSGQRFQAHRVQGAYLDGGSFSGLQAAGNYISSQLATIWHN